MASHIKQVSMKEAKKGMKTCSAGKEREVKKEGGERLRERGVGPREKESSERVREGVRERERELVPW